MEWDEYYEKCGEWSDSTKISKISQISSFGSHSEVWEIAQDYMDGKAAGRLIKKAMINDVHFTGEEIVDMIMYVETDIINRALETAVTPLNSD